MRSARSGATSTAVRVDAPSDKNSSDMRALAVRLLKGLVERIKRGKAKPVELAVDRIRSRSRANAPQEVAIKPVGKPSPHLLPSAPQSPPVSECLNRRPGEEHSAEEEPLTARVRPSVARADGARGKEFHRRIISQAKPARRRGEDADGSEEEEQADLLACLWGVWRGE
jgi:hypothetical protein